jgi:hypothetical protein
MAVSVSPRAVILGRRQRCSARAPAITATSHPTADGFFTQLRQDQTRRFLYRGAQLASRFEKVPEHKLFDPGFLACRKLARMLPKRVPAQGLESTDSNRRPLSVGAVRGPPRCSNTFEFITVERPASGQDLNKEFQRLLAGFDCTETITPLFSLPLGLLEEVKALAKRLDVDHISDVERLLQYTNFSRLWRCCGRLPRHWRKIDPGQSLSTLSPD